jgi:hypothetical protein
MNKREKATVLWEALRDLHSNETFERALGRYVRNHRGDYKDYIELISVVRDMAKKKKLDILDAAKKLAESYES